MVVVTVYQQILRDIEVALRRGAVEYVLSEWCRL